MEENKIIEVETEQKEEVLDVKFGKLTQKLMARDQKKAIKAAKEAKMTAEEKKERRLKRIGTAAGIGGAAIGTVIFVGKKVAKAVRDQQAKLDGEAAPFETDETAENEYSYVDTTTEEVNTEA